MRRITAILLPSLAILFCGCSQAGAPSVPLFGRSMANSELSRGDHLYSKGQYPQANTAYQHAIRLDPSAPVAMPDSDRSHSAKGDWKKRPRIIARREVRAATI